MELHYTKLSKEGKIVIPSSYRKHHNLDTNTKLYVIEENKYLLLSPHKPQNEKYKSIKLDSLGRINFNCDPLDIHIIIEIYENDQILITTYAVNLYDEQIRYKRKSVSKNNDFCIVIPSAILSEIEASKNTHLYCKAEKNKIILSASKGENTAKFTLDNLNRVCIEKDYFDNIGCSEKDEMYVELFGNKIFIYKV